MSDRYEGYLLNVEKITQHNEAVARRLPDPTARAVLLGANALTGALIVLAEAIRGRDS